MAATVDTTMRAAFTSQALATMGVDPVWDTALSNYLRLEALDWADFEFGPMSVATEACNWAQIKLTEKYGKAWRKQDGAKAEWQASFEDMGCAEDLHCETYSVPHWGAAQMLMETPATTLAAALFKVLMIEREGLSRNNAVDGHCMVFVQQDMAGLAAEHLRDE